jgi:hypothetical protein
VTDRRNHRDLHAQLFQHVARLHTQHFQHVYVGVATTNQNEIGRQRRLGPIHDGGRLEWDRRGTGAAALFPSTWYGSLVSALQELFASESIFKDKERDALSRNGPRYCIHARLISLGSAGIVNLGFGWGVVWCFVFRLMRMDGVCDSFLTLVLAGLAL